MSNIKKLTPQQSELIRLKQEAAKRKSKGCGCRKGESAKQPDKTN